MGELEDQTEVMSASYNIAWIPCNPEFSYNRLFDISSARDSAIERFVESYRLLSSNGFVCNTIDLCDQIKVDVVIFYGMSSEIPWLVRAIKNNHNVRLINIPIEPPVISTLHNEAILSSMPFDRILTWNDDLVTKGNPFVKANIGEAVIHTELIPYCHFKKKKFLVAICSSKLIRHENGIHEERFRAFEFFSKKKEGMELYGIGWKELAFPFVNTSYRGTCKTKKDILKDFKFSICFENAKGYPGLITEKIFDCFAAGTVPIYYGPPNIEVYIPRNCYINFCSFTDYEALYQFLINMTEKEHQAYLDAVKRFVASDAYYQFTSKRFAEIILEQVQSLLVEPKPCRTVISFKWSLLKIVLRHPLLFLKNIKQCRRFLFDVLFSF